MKMLDKKMFMKKIFSEGITNTEIGNFKTLGCIVHSTSVLCKINFFGCLVGKDRQARRRLNGLASCCCSPWLQKEHFIFFFDTLSFYGRIYFINELYCLKNTGTEGRQHDKMGRAVVWSSSFFILF